MKWPEFFLPQVINSKLDKEFKLRPLVLIGCLLVASIVITNVIGTKIMTFLNFNFTAGVITYGMVFLGTDIIGEIWGKRTAYYFVILGFLANIVLIAFIQVAIISPPATFWEQNQEAYSKTLGGVWIIVIASMTAYLFSQFHDVWAFDFWRRKTKGKKLWLRNIMSTIASQFIDTIIFIIIAFVWHLTWTQIILMIFGQIIIKWGIAILDTPIIYGLKKWIGDPIKGAHPDYD